MRVAFTTLAPFIGGAERSLQVTLTHLPQAGVDPLVIGPADAKIRPWCEANEIPFHPCPLSLRDKWHLLRWWSSVRQLRSILRRERVDVVHANQMYCYPAIGTAARELGLPRVCHLRDEVSEPALKWYCASGVESIICISRHIANQADVAWPTARPKPNIETLLNPVVIPPRETLADNLREVRESLRLPTSRHVFGFVGQIVPVKGLLQLLHIFRDLRSDQRWHLAIAGCDPHPGSPHECECRTFVLEAGLRDRVTFLGYLDDVDTFYRAIDVAVVPSLIEPLGRVPLEAAAYGKAAIASAVGGLVDTVEHARTGWLVLSESDEGWKSALLDVMSTSPREFGNAARARVERIADPVNYARALASQYANLTRRIAEVPA